MPIERNGDMSTSKEVRQRLLGIIKNLVIGPFEEEELLSNIVVEAEPTEIYLTGILWPRDMRIGPGEDENTDRADSNENEPGDDSGAPLFSILKPSSIGLTCSIEGENTAFTVVVRGAHYTKTLALGSETINPSDETNREGDATDRYPELRTSAPKIGDDKSKVFDWKRMPFEYRVPVSGTLAKSRTSDFVTSDGRTVTDSRLSVYIKRRVREGVQIITASLINLAELDEGESPGPLAIYQSELEIHAIDENGGGKIISRPLDLGMADEDSRVGNLLYRTCQEFAVGHGIAPTWPEPISDRVVRVTTDWMPATKVNSVSTTGHEALRSLSTAENSPLRATFLAQHDQRRPIINGLGKLVEAYASWVEGEEARLPSIEEKLRTTAKENLATCRQTIQRIRDGIETLETNDQAFLAFCLANEAMDAQSSGRQRGSLARPLKWFPFQLAFLLMSLKSIVEPDDPTREVMDLLWFPTGGGKTEAYLGLSAFTIFYRRLSFLGDPINRHTDVLMRYTLRLLTVQQFQRAAALICAADQIRSRRTDLGHEPISIGLFVGQAATPNRLVEGLGNALDTLEAESRGQPRSSTPRLLLNCPLCGSDLSTECYKVDRAIPSLNITCPDPTCPSAGSCLPIYTVDEDIYRVRPSLIIGTVDKFAQLPRKEDLGSLFGKPRGLPPDLIIQDELHLISGPLGTVTGLYEACVDLLCMRDGRPPKIVGSTATIGRAKQQIRALFNRGVLQFPPSAIDSDDSFFAVTDRDAPDRLYVGISSAGRSPKFTLQAITAAALVAAQNLRDKGVEEDILDPYWTALLYFNSLRELGGAEVMMHDDVPRTVDFYSNRLHSTARNLEGQPAQLNSRIASTKIPQILKDLQIGLQSDPFSGDPVDIVLASNMISVGMDISRLGLMIVNGQPKSTSEYIQATSRVGRGIPGLIFTSFNGSRPRDLSHFEHFTHYHQTLYRRVEATSVTPWSSRARDRALHAVFIAAVRHLVPGMSGRFSAAGFDPRDPEVLQIRDWLVSRASNAGTEHVTLDEIKADLQNIIDRWAQRSRVYGGNKKFEYWATSRPFDNRPVNPHLMRGAEDPVIDPWVWATPGSMREVEPSAYYVLWQNSVQEGD